MEQTPSPGGTSAGSGEPAASSPPPTAPYGRPPAPPAPPAPPPPPPYGGPQPPQGPFGPQGPGGPQGSGGEPPRSGGFRAGAARFFAGVRSTGLVRSEHRIVGGVCGGISQRTGIDPTVVRVLTVVFAVFGGLGFLAYGLAWRLLPEPDGRIHGEQVLEWNLDAGSVGALVLTVLSLGGSGGWHHWSWGWGGGPLSWLWSLAGTTVGLALIVLVVWLVVRGRSGRPGAGPGAGPTPGQHPGPYGSAPFAPYPASPTAGYATPAAYPTHPGDGPVQPAAGPIGGTTMTATMTAPPAAPPVGGLEPGAVPPPAAAPRRTRRPSLGWAGVLLGAGLALVAGAVTQLVVSSGDHDVSAAAMGWAVGLGVLALVLVVGGLLGRRSGALTFFALVAVAGTLVSSVLPNLTTWRVPASGPGRRCRWRRWATATGSASARPSST